MSVTLITIIITGVVVFVVFILGWHRDSVIVRICPREILFLESVEERYRVHGRGLNAFLRHRSTWTAFVTYTLALGVPSVVVSAGLLTIAHTRAEQWSVTVLKSAAILCALLPALLLIPLMHLRFRKWMRVFLREYLNDHGIPICQNCGYDLRGQVNPPCPECGAGRDRSGAVEDESRGTDR